MNINGRPLKYNYYDIIKDVTDCIRNEIKTIEELGKTANAYRKILQKRNDLLKKYGIPSYEALRKYLKRKGISTKEIKIQIRQEMYESV